jgi:hypothetical protein
MQLLSQLSTAMNNQTDKINTLTTAVAILETKIETINQQLESKNRWLQGIGIAVIGAVLLWAGKTIVEANATPKNTPVIPVTQSK